MLQIKDLQLSYGQERIIDGVNLELSEGESLAIVGESGTGKTSLALSIVRLTEANLKGHIYFKKKDLLRLPEKDMNKIRWQQIAIAFQNVNNVLNPVLSILTQVTESIQAHAFLSSKEAQMRAGKLLSQFAFPEHRFLAYPHQLSGGEQQKALVAMALANDPDLLILDEPLSSLDATSRLELVDKLKKLHGSCARLVLTHDLDTANRIADKMAVLYGGKIVEMGATRDILTCPRHPYTRALIRSYPNMSTLKDLQGIKGHMMRLEKGCPFHPRCTQAIGICQSELPHTIWDKKRYIACHRGGIITYLSTINLTKCFNSRKVVDTVSISIEAGETLALVGESGSGKTTLAKMIMGIYEPTSGTIYLENKKVDRRGKDFYQQVQMVFQNPGESLSHRLNVLDAVMEPLVIQKIGENEERKTKALKVIGEVELPTTPDFLQKYPHQLSGGEMQRVAIARALILDPELLIADEPTSFLDASVQAKIIKLLLNLQEQRGLSLLYITHNIAAARKVSDRIAVMFHGKIIENEPSPKLITNPKHSYTKKLLEAGSGLEHLTFEN